MSQPTDDPIWAAVAEKTCAVCLDRTDTGACAIPGHGDCKLRTFFPALVDIVRRVRSTSMDPYVAAVEAEICSRCAENGPSGCAPRNRGECALYAFLPVTVDAVEDALWAIS